MAKLKIVKDNSLIENFIFNATEFELQILNYAVAITNPYWKNQSTIVYKISISELIKNYGSKNKDVYSRYRDALLRLQCRTYSYYIDDEKYTENIITKVIENMKDNSYLEFSFNDYISNRIQNLKGLFTQYDIKNISLFRSRYAFMLYEFFKMKLEQTEGVYQKKYLIDDIRDNLDLKNKYKHFRDLRIKVLDISKSQINKHSDIRINYVIIKTGRTPTHIKFTAQYKKDKKPQIKIDEPQSKRIKTEEEKKMIAKKSLEDIRKSLKL